MPQTPDVRFSTTDNTTSVTPAQGGTNWVVVQTKWGPYYDTSKIITSWPEFKKIYGGLSESLPDVLQCKTALEGGSKLRVCKIAHKDTGTSTAVKATQVGTVENSANVELFAFEPLNAGAAYNDLIVSVKSASNGVANQFDVVIGLYPSDDEGIVENFPNLGITADNITTFLTEIAQKSKLVKPVYKTLDVEDVATFVPEVTTLTFEAGTNGAAVVDADYVEGLQAFNPVQELALVAIPSKSSNDVNVGIKAYVELRKDIHGVCWLGDSDDEADIISARTTLGADTRYVYLIGGKEVDYSPYSNPSTKMVEYSPVAGVLAAQAKQALNPWISFSGSKKGKRNVFGVVNNFGTPAKAAALQLLNQQQINMVVTQDGVTYILGGFTSQRNLSQLSFIGISQLDLFIKASLKPTYRGFLEEPLDFVLVRRMADTVIPFLEDLKKTKRALFSYEYNGDQGVNRLEDLVVNDAAKFQLGEYKVKIPIKAIAALQAVDVEIVLTSGSSVSTN